MNENTSPKCISELVDIKLFNQMAWNNMLPRFAVYSVIHNQYLTNLQSTMDDTLKERRYTIQAIRQGIMRTNTKYSQPLP